MKIDYVVRQSPWKTISHKLKLLCIMYNISVTGFYETHNNQSFTVKKFKKKEQRRYI